MAENSGNQVIAYFSMEIAADAAIPTYSGGLGVLAGDALSAAADLGMPVVAVTLVHHHGYFQQLIDGDGIQTEIPTPWNVAKELEPLSNRVSVFLEGVEVIVGVWRRTLTGVSGRTVPIYFLDTKLAENSPEHQKLTDSLYGGDECYRLCQEAILGLGGIRMLRSLGYHSIARYHLNEGHSALIALELIEELHRGREGTPYTPDELQNVRERCVFTTHTPVAAAFDQFPMSLVRRVLGKREALDLDGIFSWQGTLNMTYLALSLSHYVNGVARKHGEIAQHLFANYKIDTISNGIHPARWVSDPLGRLFDERLRGWREDNFALRSALSIPRDEIWLAHLSAKQQLLDLIKHHTPVPFDRETLTIGFARRFTSYKRPTLLFTDIERLRELAMRHGPLQLVFAGKAHPKDLAGKELIRKISECERVLRGDIRMVFLPDYDLTMARILTAGVDVWLNTPEPPLEASGTSGMKAAVNGVPSLSILDGWWFEGWIEEVTGWAFGNAEDRSLDADSLYKKLETAVLPTFYSDHAKFLDMMRYAIALNGSFFHTQRMVQQYAVKAYFD